MQIFLLILVIDLIYLIVYENGKEKVHLFLIILIYTFIYYFESIYLKPIRIILEITIPSFIFFQFYDLKRNKALKSNIVILGCGLLDQNRISSLLMQRCNIAIQLYNENIKIICSGGQGKDEIISEAYAMKQYLIENNIPKENIVSEDKSTNTIENLLYTSNLIGNNFTVITSDYHRLRVYILAYKLKLNINVKTSKTIFYYYIYACIREYIAILSNYPLTLLICYFLLFFLQ